MGTGMAPPPWPPAHYAASSSARPQPHGRTRAARYSHGSNRSIDSGKGPRHGQASRPISSARLCASPRLHLRPIDPVFSRGPSGGTCPRGLLISGRASRLDAFSGYPSRTWPPGRAAGATTGMPEVRPPRSSRTKGRPPQESCARNR